MRKSGMSYSQIKVELGVSKSTLSLWLRDLPLSDERLRALRDFNQVRIEKTRQTKLQNKKARRQIVLEKVRSDLETSNSPLFVGGFYLYWGEGTKSSEYSVALTSTDPAIIRTFLAWLVLLGADISKCHVKLHVYSDQNIKEIIHFWSKQTNLSSSHFYKPYVKKTTLQGKTYKGMFGFGTCTVYYHNRDVYEYVMAGLEILRNQY